MDTDPTNPYGDGSQEDDGFPDDSSWYEFVGGIWRRMTDTAPYTGESA